MAAFSILVLWPGVGAFEQLGLTIQQLETAAWRAEQLHFSLDLSQPDNTAYRLEIARFDWLDPQQTLRDITIDCVKGSLSDRRISCEKGRLSLPWQGLDDPHAEFSFSFEQSGGKLHGRLRGVAVAGGKAEIDFQQEQEQWTVSLHGRGLALKDLPALLPDGFKLPPGWSVSGELEMTARITGTQGDIESADWRATLVQTGFSDAAGENAGDGLGGTTEGRLVSKGGRWKAETQLSLRQGELLTPRFYLNASQHPLRLVSNLDLAKDFRQLQLERIELELQGLLSARASADLLTGAPAVVNGFSLEVEPFRIGEVYRELLQPVLSGTAWDGFELAGTGELAVKSDGDLSSLDLWLQSVHLDDAKSDSRVRRIGLYDLSGRLHWSRGGEAEPSWLAWQSGHLLEQLDLGPTRLDFELDDRTVNLLRQATLPVVDGRLVVDRLEIQDLAGPDQEIRFDAVLEPVSMAALSKALGWPPLSGKLSGVLPGLSYRRGKLDIDGVLLVRIFDGDILIRDLQLQDLFGVYPQLQANIEMKSLDLETLTETFSFGKITGKLDGYIRNLRLEDWRPVSFDAHFQTPENDRSRRRISQKAVDNISNLGGAGLSGSLARSFLGMFEEFRYKRIGIGCRLQNDTCEMSGVGKAKQGYYLVEGSGIPRIDIIGYNRTADWSRMLEQLQQISESGAPVIQ